MPLYYPNSAGYVGEAQLSGMLTGISAETVPLSYTWQAVLGQRYKVTLQCAIQSTAALDQAVLRIRQAYSISIANTDTSIRAGNALVMDTAGEWQLYTFVTQFVATQSGNCTVGATLLRSTGTGTLTFSGTGNEGTAHLLVEMC